LFDNDDGVTHYVEITDPMRAMGWITTRMKDYIIVGTARLRNDFADIMQCIQTNLRRDDAG
jgi:hypothetical protein